VYSHRLNRADCVFSVKSATINCIQCVENICGEWVRLRERRCQVLEWCLASGACGHLNKPDLRFSDWIAIHTMLCNGFYTLYTIRLHYKSLSRGLTVVVADIMCSHRPWPASFPAQGVTHCLLILFPCFLFSLHTLIRYITRLCLIGFGFTALLKMANQLSGVEFPWGWIGRLSLLELDRAWG